jgi:hypothetical protein
LSELRQRGFSLQRIRRVIRYLRQELGKRLVETVTAASEYHLLTDGRHIYLEDSARGVVDLLKNARQPMLTVCLSDAIQRVLSPVERPADAPGQKIAITKEGTKGRRPPERAMAHSAPRHHGPVRHLRERASRAS